MAKDVALFGGSNVPAHLKKGEVGATTKALAGGGSNLKRISIRGSVFRMMVGNEEISKNKERSMNMVIIASAEGFARTFYKGRYVEGENAPPTCWSDDGERPSPNVPEDQKQSTKCAKCPQNIKGSGDQGDSRACRFSARVAVVLDGDMGGDVYGLSVPATSLFGDVDEDGYYALQKYARMLAGHGYDISTVVTEVMFDTDAATPKLMFKAVRPLEEEEWETVQAQMDHEDVDNHTGPREFRSDDEEDGTPEADPMAGEGESDEEAEERKAEAAKRKKQADARRKKREKEHEEKLAAAKKEEAEEEPKADDEAETEEEEPEPEVKSAKKADDVDVDDDDLDALLDEWDEDDD